MAFLDEKMFNLNRIYSTQNNRIWAASREEADRNGGVYPTTKFPIKVTVWMGACSEGLIARGIFG